MVKRRQLRKRSYGTVRRRGVHRDLLPTLRARDDGRARDAGPALRLLREQDLRRPGQHNDRLVVLRGRARHQLRRSRRGKENGESAEHRVRHFPLRCSTATRPFTPSSASGMKASFHTSQPSSLWSRRGTCRTPCRGRPVAHDGPSRDRKRLFHGRNAGNPSMSLCQIDYE